MKAKLNFNHPCKELVWVVTDGDADNNNWMNYTTDASDATKKIVVTDKTDSAILEKLAADCITSKNPINFAKLVLNGNDRFAQRDGLYFNLVQPFQHHENVPSNAGINVYSFALKPEEHQPSGTLNMSRIDTANLNVSSDYSSANNKNLNVYTVNYNVLRIMSGMGGIAYSN